MEPPSVDLAGPGGERALPPVGMPRERDRFVRRSLRLGLGLPVICSPPVASVFFSKFTIVTHCVGDKKYQRDTVYSGVLSTLGSSVQTEY